MGYYVNLVTLNNDLSLVSQYSDVNFKITRLGVKKSFSSIMNGLYKLHLLVKLNNINVIHAHMFHSLIFSVIIKLFNPRIKVIFTSHSYGGFGGLRGVLIKLTKRLRAIDVIFAKDQHLALNSKNTIVIKNSVDVPFSDTNIIRERCLQKGVVFLFLGRLEPPKNPIAMISHFAKMNNTDSILKIAGDGALKEEIKKAIAAHGLGDRIEMIGVVSDVPTLLKSVDCLVMPSLWEGLPMAILEAGAHSLPVISTPVGSIPDLLGDKCGYLAGNDDFSYMLDFVADNLEAAQLCGQRLQNKILRDYSLNRMVSQHVSVYEEVVGCDFY